MIYNSKTKLTRKAALNKYNYIKNNFIAKVIKSDS